MINGYVLKVTNKMYYLFYNDILIANSDNLDYVLSFYKEKVAIGSNIKTESI